MPDVGAGAARVDAVARIVASVGVPVLFLGGPRSTHATARRDPARDPRDDVLDEVRDVMAGGAAGLAVGRVVLPGPRPGHDGRLVAEAVRDGARRAAGTVPA